MHSFLNTTQFHDVEKDYAVHRCSAGSTPSRAVKAPFLTGAHKACHMSCLTEFIMQHVDRL